jgi:hypothetical protein
MVRQAPALQIPLRPSRGIRRPRATGAWIWEGKSKFLRAIFDFRKIPKI